MSLVETPTDNPAGRLHKVLTDLQGMAVNQTIEDALTEVLEIEGDDRYVRLHEYLSLVVRWPVDAADAIRRLPDENHALLLQWTGPVEQAVIWMGRWAHTVNNLQSQYNETTMYSLAVTADLLHRRCPEPVIEAGTLEALVGLVREVIDAVVADEQLPAEAREFLLGRLLEVQQALLHFRIVGYPGVADAMDRLVGGLVRNPEAQNERTTGGVRRILVAVQQALRGTKELADTGSAAAAAIEAGKGLFGG